MVRGTWEESGVVTSLFSVERPEMEGQWNLLTIPPDFLYILHTAYIPKYVGVYGRAVRKGQ